MSLEATLSTVETQLQDVQDALMATDPLALEQAATQLRVAATTLSQALAGSGSGAQASPLTEAQTQRIRAIGTRLPLLRDQLARLLALTERQAASLLPPAQGVMTYGSGPGQGAARGARIYRAPG
ncbi:hypothetical protein [Acidovorax sp. FG27]|uniref:hypothetical protein n=1 Tax=Acidovorax sp. FG27 TaxID=3133652 RepID=UPI0030E928B5